MFGFDFSPFNSSLVNLCPLREISKIGHSELCFEVYAFVCEKEKLITNILVMQIAFPLLYLLSDNWFLYKMGRPTIFVEIIQRVGCMLKDEEGRVHQKGGCGGFGKGNFSEIFKSIEEYEKTLEAKQIAEPAAA